jgi:hypothetical protein
MVEVLESIGINIKWIDNDLEIQPEKINLKNVILKCLGTF